MRLNYLIWHLLFALLFSMNLSAQNFLEKINFDDQAFTEKETFELFEVTGRFSAEPGQESGLQNGLLLKPDFDIIDQLLNDSEKRIKISLPTSEENSITLLLQEVDVLIEGATIKSSSGEVFKLDNHGGRFFWGVVDGAFNSMVNITVFKEQLIGYVSIGMHDFTLGRLDEADNLHVFYYNNDLNLPFSFECHMTEDHRIGEVQNYHHNNARSTGGCINIYVETDYNVFQDKGSVNSVVEYVLGLFSQVIILYADESIDLAVSEILVWDSPSPYSGNDAFDFLEDFSDALNGNFNGDLAHLLRIDPNLGGVAWVDVLCSWDPYFQTGFSGIASTYENVPTYSWSVSVVAHEIGHNVGSGHTHGCLWNNNNTQIDDCGNVHANNNGFDPEGAACFNAGNPVLPSNGGTIMSYCHLLGNVGINFNNGFGQQPGDLMRSRVNNASCLGDCADFDPPVAAFSADPTYGCAPMEVQFTDLSENDPSSWDWSFPGGNPVSSNEQFPTVSYEFAGVFDVSLEVTNDDGTDFLIIPEYITVEDFPTAAYSFNVDGLIVGFINGSEDAFSYLWDFGDGNFSSQESPVYTYQNSGTYNVVLTVYNNCGEDVYSVLIDVFEMPEASFSFNVSSGCAPLAVQFVNTSSGSPDFFSWEFPGGSPTVSNEENPEIAYLNAGVFDVSLTVSNPVGNSTIEESDLIEVFAPTKADFEYEIELRKVTFKDLSVTSDSLSWDFGDGTTSNDTMPEHEYGSDGVYEVILIASGSCGVDTMIKSIVILTPPTAAFEFLELGNCVPVSVTFINLSSSNTDSIYWFFPGGNPSMASSDTIEVSYFEAGNYGIQMIAFGPGGLDTLVADSLMVLKASPSGDFDFEIDEFVVVFLQDLSGADSWEWDFGDGNLSNDENPTHVYSEEGRFDAILKVFNDCDTIEIRKSITIGNFPLASFSIEGESAGCAPLSISFLNQSTPGNSGIEWIFEGGIPAISNDPNPIVTYENPGVYSVKLRVFNPLGEDFIELENIVEVISLPEANFSVMEGEEGVFEFINSSEGAENYFWNFGDGNTSDEENPEHQYQNSGNYSVELIVLNACGSDTLTQVVQYTFVHLFDEVSVRLFPNPSAGQVYVEFSEMLTSHIQYRIFDITGKEMRSAYIDRLNLKQQIDLGGFASGTYFIQFFTDRKFSRPMQVQIIRD